MGRGFGISAAVDHDVVLEIAREAERLGYSSFWVNDVPFASGLASLATAAAATERIRLGVGVIPLDSRPPAWIIEHVRSLGLPLDRLVLGVGSGDSPRPRALVSAGLHALGEALAVPLVVGALGPRMVELAGREGNGVLFNWMTPGYAGRAGAGVVEAAARAGRPRSVLMAYVRCGYLPEAEQLLDQELRRYEGIPHFGHHLDRMGATARETCVLATRAETLQAGIAPFEAVLDETIVRSVAPEGSRPLLELLEACAPAEGAW